MTSPDDPFDLARFVTAQAAIWPAPLIEIAHGRKTSHWMWFVFPQIAGFGHSAMAQRYALGSCDGARAYLTHPLLGTRLRHCVAALATLSPASVMAVFGGIDAMKLRSSLTIVRGRGRRPRRRRRARPVVRRRP